MDLKEIRDKVEALAKQASENKKKEVAFFLMEAVNNLALAEMFDETEDDGK